MRAPEVQPEEPSGMLPEEVHLPEVLSEMLSEALPGLLLPEVLLPGELPPPSGELHWYL